MGALIPGSIYGAATPYDSPNLEACMVLLFSLRLFIFYLYTEFMDVSGAYSPCTEIL